MYERSINSKLDILKNNRKIATELFLKKFPNSITYDFMNVISAGMMQCNSLEEYVKLLCAFQYKYTEKFSLEEDSFVEDCIEIARIYAGKKEQYSLSRYSWIHASPQLVNHYKIKALEAILRDLTEV